MISRVAAWISRLLVDTSIKVIELGDQLEELKAETEKRDQILSTSCRPDLNHTDEWWRQKAETGTDDKQ
jgi:hypothetical protein